MATIKVNPFKHHLSKWPIVLPLYDGRQCPECSAVVFGWQAQQTHKTYHKRFAALDKAVRQLIEAVRVLATDAGFAIREAPVEDGGEDDDEGLDVDERLQVKVGRVLGTGPLPEEMRGGEAE